MDAETLALRLLDALEDREFLSLQWGFVDGAFTEDEILEQAAHTIREHDAGDEVEPELLLDALDERRLLFEVRFADRTATYRTRFAESVRLLSRLRQWFPGQPWQTAPNLVSDYRLMVRPRRYPDFVLLPEEVISRALSGETLSANAGNALTSLLENGGNRRRLAEFQWQTFAGIRNCLASPHSNGIIVCAGTGSGKTLAAYLPLLVEMADLVRPNDYWTKLLCLYPRNELLKDQASSILRETDRLATDGVADRPLRVGTFYSATPFRASYVEQMADWRRYGNGYVCPHFLCPRCDGVLIWPDDAWQSNRELLRCEACAYEVGEDRVVLTRQRMIREPPDLLFTSTESLNRQLAHTEYQSIFGANQSAERTPRCVLLDEVHTYEDIPGAQVGLLLRRWRYATNHRPVQWIGLSATLRNPLEFFSQIVDLPLSRVQHVEPCDEVVRGREYLIALRGDPASRASLLSTTIQTAMLIGRVLDPQPANPGQQYEPPSRGVFGRRAFLFTDDLDVTNRLFHDILSAEGATQGRGTPLADLRASGADAPEARDALGQNWWMPEEIGHPLHVGRGLNVGRTSSQDRGVDELSNLVVCTAALEVGYDDDSVGAVLQHKAPMNVASFLQRKGRAGRLRHSRPWTVLVLSDYGRDRIAYQSPEHIFEPTLEPRRLPMTNRYVLRMQAVYAFMDWFARHARELERRISVWTAFERPGDKDYQRDVQRWAQTAIERIMERPDLTSDLQDYLIGALDIDSDEAIRLLWEHPRPLMTTVLPTIHRRLATEWRAVRRDGTFGRDLTRPFNPLPDFVPANLFSDLQLPELGIQLPGEHDLEVMPLLQGLRTFVPGKVTRRFAGDLARRSHWVPITGVPNEAVAVESFCTASEPMDDVTYCKPSGETVTLPCQRPLEYRVEECPEQRVSVMSNAFLDWHSQIFVERVGTALDLGRLGRWGTVINGIEVFTHGQTRPITVRRFAASAAATYHEIRQQPRDCSVQFVRGNPAAPVAIGFEIEVDGLKVSYQLPPAVGNVTDSEERLREYRPAYFRDLVTQDPQLLRLANAFRLQWVAEIHIAALAAVAIRDDSQTVIAADALATDYLPTVDQVMNEVLQLVEVAEDQFADSKLRTELRELFQQSLLCKRMRDLEPVLWSKPDDALREWVRMRFVATLGGAVLQACHIVGTRGGSGDLLLDIDGGVQPHSNGNQTESAFWITESSPGGNGVIEEIARRINDDPARFMRVLSDTLAPSDFELIDDQLTVLLSRLLTGDPALVDCVGRVRSASCEADLAAARDNLLRAIKSAGLVPSRPFVVAVNARLLPPGSNADRDRLLEHLLEYREQVERALGFEMSYREFACISSWDAETTEILRRTVGRDLDRHERFVALAGLLWPRASSVRGQALTCYNPFRAHPTPDRRLVSDALPDDLLCLDDRPDFLSTLIDRLRSVGEARVRVSRGAEERLRKLLLDLASEPIALDYLHAFPRIVGVTQADGLVVAIHVEEVLP